MGFYCCKFDCLYEASRILRTNSKNYMVVCLYCQYGQNAYQGVQFYEYTDMQIVVLAFDDTAH